jgi:hypothetical protein
VTCQVFLLGKDRPGFLRYATDVLEVLADLFCERGEADSENGIIFIEVYDEANHVQA